MPTEKEIGKKIAGLRAERGLTQARLGDALCVSAQAIGKWERGESMPDIGTLAALCEILGTDLNGLTGMTGRGGDGGADADGPRKPVFDMSAASWKNLDFSGLKNLGGKLGGSNVLDCRFCAADMRGIKFSGNNIKNCDFTGSDFSACAISRSDIASSTFTRCDLRNGDLKWNSVRDCDFTGADLSGLSAKGCDFKKCVFTNASFCGAEFNLCDFGPLAFDADVTDCSFVFCNLKAEFKGVTFKNTFFKHCKLKKAVFSDCYADKTSFAFLTACGVAKNAGIRLLDGAGADKQRS
jgi:uncharacterized protein YjbI with pentapeptide repeats/DNA-binding XRE family transcriptional regulator